MRLLLIMTCLVILTVLFIYVKTGLHLLYVMGFKNVHTFDTKHKEQYAMGSTGYLTCWLNYFGQTLELSTAVSIKTRKQSSRSRTCWILYAIGAIIYLGSSSGFDLRCLAWDVSPVAPTPFGFLLLFFFFFLFFSFFFVLYYKFILYTLEARSTQ